MEAVSLPANGIASPRFIEKCAQSSDIASQIAEETRDFTDCAEWCDYGYLPPTLLDTEGKRWQVFMTLIVGKHFSLLEAMRKAGKLPTTGAAGRKVLAYIGESDSWPLCKWFSTHTSFPIEDLQDGVAEAIQSSMKQLGDDWYGFEPDRKNILLWCVKWALIEPAAVGATATAVSVAVAGVLDIAGQACDLAAIQLCAAKIGIPDLQLLLERACFSGKVRVIKWLMANHGATPADIRRACTVQGPYGIEEGHVTVLKWFKRRTALSR